MSAKSKSPHTPAAKLEFVTQLLNYNFLTKEELLALLDGLTLEQYRAQQTSLGKFLAGLEEEK